ncbi:hypothetical protein J4405_00660 [Candidatus Woesearchaeota archaeon]|nr:hypothetical protein [Candidatus Woesearchaeota archaeon]
MDSEVELYLIRAEDEFLLAEKDFQMSTDEKIKEILGILKEKTFFYSTITHAYYSIFYAAKSYLLSKNIKTEAPEEHKKTYDEFSKFVKNGVLDRELLRIYDEELMKSDSLLKIFRIEKKKRGYFTYNIKSEANLPYAKESIDNARVFISKIKVIVK